MERGAELDMVNKGVWLIGLNLMSAVVMLSFLFLSINFQNWPWFVLTILCLVGAFGVGIRVFARERDTFDQKGAFEIVRFAKPYMTPADPAKLVVSESRGKMFELTPQD